MHRSINCNHDVKISDFNLISYPQAKALAARDVFRPAMAIVEDVVRRIVPEEEMFLAPKMDLLKRASNLHRSKVRPTEPSDINFEVRIYVF